MRPFLFRRKFLTHPRFQLLLLGVNLGTLSLSSLVIWVSVQNTLLDLKPVAGLSGVEAEHFKNYLDYQIHNFQNSMLMALAIGLLFAGTVTLFISHRIAGPLIRLRNYFENLARGDDPISKISFRDGDYLNELAPVINDAVVRIQESNEHSSDDLAS